MRMTRLLAIAVLLLSACATPTDAPLTNAIAGQSADVVITGLGLELVEGVTEANPLGVGLLIVKPAAVWWADSLPEPDRTQALNVLGATGWAATAHNVCMLAFDPASVASCVALGIAAGFWQYHHETSKQQQQHGTRPATP